MIKYTRFKEYHSCLPSSRDVTHSRTMLSEAPDLNRIPVCQFPVPAISSSNSPLCPKTELDEVQNGITVFPVKSFDVINLFTGHEAIPHQIG